MLAVGTAQQAYKMFGISSQCFTVLGVLGLFMAKVATADNSDTVEVTLFYETLCPDCRQFIVNQLYDSYVTFGPRYVSLQMVPYGFVRGQNGEQQCQHGPNECYGNKIHGCALEHFLLNKTIKFIDCCEASEMPTQNATFEKCCQESGIQWSTIATCLDSGEAEKIFERNGVKTRAANPQSVPHLLFNGVYNATLENEAIDDFSAVLCKILDYKPVVCQKENMIVEVNII